MELLCDKRQFTQVPKWASQIQLLLYGPSSIFIGEVCVWNWEMLQRIATLHYSPYQDRAQHKVDSCFPCCLSKNPISSTKGLALINGSIRSYRQGYWEHWCFLSYHSPAIWFIQLQSQAHDFPCKSHHLHVLRNEVEKSSKQRTKDIMPVYPLHMHNGEHNTMSL